MDRIQFKDGNGNEVTGYNPYNLKKEMREIGLAENEELIGVYGSYELHNENGDGDEYEDEHNFTSFGFIVKVKTFI